MTTRFERDRADVSKYLPANTVHDRIEGLDVWTFVKNTELQLSFKISIYFCPDEAVPGYCAQLVSPPVEKSWRSVHVGHLFDDGVICLGGESMRTRRTLREAYAKSCLWAEGIAVMLASKSAGCPSEFPFSANNTKSEVRDR